MSKRRYTSLADYFARSGDTQEALAARIKRSQATISLALNYGRGSYKTLKAISEETGVPLDSFDRKDAA